MDSLLNVLSQTEVMGINFKNLTQIEQLKVKHLKFRGIILC